MLENVQLISPLVSNENTKWDVTQHFSIPISGNANKHENDTI